MAAQISMLATLGSEPENRITPNGHENIQFRCAVNDRRGDQETTTWYSVTAWSGTAKGLTTLAERGLLAKGARVFVAGTLTTREYTDRNGNARTSLDVNASNVELASPPRTAQPSAYGGYGSDEPGYVPAHDGTPLNEVPF